MRLPLALISLAVIIFSIGCSGNTESAEGPPEPTKVPFVGEPEPRFVGTWKLDGKDSTYTIRKDGTYSFKGMVSTQGGSFENKFDGEWKANDGQLLFKDGQGAVVPYNYKLEGNKLTLTLTGTMKRETVLLKQ
jgi:hypothetical protein